MTLSIKLLHTILKCFRELYRLDGKDITLALKLKALSQQILIPHIEPKEW